jgi:metallo-beta-lactamase family protein
VVIAASGMCEAGRILHHLRHGVTQEKNTILIVGYQAQHTLGRRIVEREPMIRIYGEMLPLRAEVAVLNGFSSHADSLELYRHTAPLADRCRKVFLVHGEMDQAESFSRSLKNSSDWDVAIPAMGDVFKLT